MKKEKGNKDEAVKVRYSISVTVDVWQEDLEAFQDALSIDTSEFSVEEVLRMYAAQVAQDRIAEGKGTFTIIG